MNDKYLLPKNITRNLNVLTQYAQTAVDCMLDEYRSLANQLNDERTAHQQTKKDLDETLRLLQREQTQVPVIASSPAHMPAWPNGTKVICRDASRSFLEPDQVYTVDTDNGDTVFLYEDKSCCLWNRSRFQEVDKPKPATVKMTISSNEWIAGAKVQCIDVDMQNYTYNICPLIKGLIYTIKESYLFGCILEEDPSGIIWDKKRFQIVSGYAVDFPLYERCPDCQQHYTFTSSHCPHIFHGERD